MSKFGLTSSKKGIRSTSAEMWLRTKRPTREDKTSSLEEAKIPPHKTAEALKRVCGIIVRGRIGRKN